VLTIGELSERTGVASSALRYYDDLGLVRPAARSGGQRRYDQDAVRQVGVVLLLRDLGFTLAEVAKLLTDRPRRRSTWERLARAKVGELERLIADAETARTALAHALDCPKDDLVACPTFWSLVDGRLEGRSLADAHRDPVRE
jgi:MerR family redox-sensitive transcriptional activator SoxR